MGGGMSRAAFVVDLLLLVGVVCFVFGVGSALLIFQHRGRDALAHPWRWLKSTYTLQRWLTTPLKMCVVAMLWQTNFQQLALTGPVASLAGDLDYRSRLFLTVSNLIGACICFYSLHLRDFEMSLRIELGSYIALIGTLGLWVMLVYLTIPIPNTSYGLNLTEAVIIGACIRAPLILRYKRALHRGDVKKTTRMRLILGGDVGP
jgi:hypothetical protein